jgi:hypothetical protein
LGALIPDRVDGLIVSDKAISVTNLINGSTRLQPVVLLTGQAAGVLAALSVNRRRAPREIPVRDVQQKLLEASAYIMPLYDVKPDDPHFQAIQKVAATGILKTEGEPYFRANRTWFHPDAHITTGEFSEGLKSFRYPVADEQNDTVLILKKCIEILSFLKRNNVEEQIINDWENISSRPFEPETPVTKREIAVLLNIILNPFSRQIDHQGVLK